MKTFILLTYPGNTPMEKNEETMMAWKAWFGSFGDKVKMTGRPSPLQNGTEVSGTDSKTMTPEMWPSDGYLFLEAESIEDVIEVAKNSPYTSNNREGVVRVYELSKG